MIVLVIFVASREWRMPDNNLVGQDTERPPIKLVIVTLLLNEFRGKIFRCTTKRIGPLLRLQLLGNAKINDCCVAIFANQHVLRLEVTVDNVLRMKMSQTKSNLECNHFGSLLREALFLLEMLEELTTANKWHDEVQFVLCLEEIIET